MENIKCERCGREYNELNLRRTQSITCWCGRVVYDAHKEEQFKQYELIQRLIYGASDNRDMKLSEIKSMVEKSIPHNDNKEEYNKLYDCLLYDAIAYFSEAGCMIVDDTNKT